MLYPDYRIILCDVLTPTKNGTLFWAPRQAMVLKKSTLRGSHGEGPSYFIDNIFPEDKLIGRTVPFLRDSIEVFDARGLTAMPTFFDMHFHWVQDDVRQMPKDSLLDWLTQYTWPTEKKFQKKSFAEHKAQKFGQELIQCGTLGGAIYASIHPHTVDFALKYFRGDFVVGNVLMTMNSPKDLIQTPKQALASVKKLSQKYKDKYALTPRFAPTTHPEVMKEGGKWARSQRSFIQTHLSETPEEVAYVLSLFKNIKGMKDVKSYTEIYQRCGLLGPRTIMGHCIHLDKKEINLLKKSKTNIAHCPSSNAPLTELGLGSGLFDFRTMNKHKIPWALASDIGGGPYLSMFDVMRSFVEQNKRKKIHASFEEALYRSTLAGAKMLKLEKTRGSLEKGKLANFILVESVSKSEKYQSGRKNGELILQKIVNRFALEREKYQTMIHSVYQSGHFLS